MSYSDNFKLRGNINPIFKPDQNRWDRNELEVISEINDVYLKKSQKVDEYYEKLKEKLDKRGFTILPHQKSIESIIYETRKMLINIINMISNEENPYNYIVSSQENIFILHYF